MVGLQEQKRIRTRGNRFRKTVQERLIEYGMQQKDLAEMMGVCPATICNLLKEPEKIPVRRLRELISILRLEESVILELYGYPTGETAKGKRPRDNPGAFI